VNGLKVVATIVFVVLIGVMVWQYLPVEVETGTAQLCQSEHHQGDQEISRETETKRVPRWRAGNYQVTGVAVICDSCQAKIDAEKREAERQACIAREAVEREAKVAEIRRSVIGRIGLVYPPVRCIYGEIEEVGVPGQWETSKKPGDFVKIIIAVLNVSDQPIDGLKVRLDVEPAGVIVRGGTRPEWQDQAREYDSWPSQWRSLTGSGMDLGSLNPANSPYYPKSEFGWGSHLGALSADAQPGTDVRITAYLVYGDMEMSMNYVTIHVMHP
jgi:hypothetical protein